MRIALGADALVSDRSSVPSTGSRVIFRFECGFARTAALAKPENGELLKRAQTLKGGSYAKAIRDDRDACNDDSLGRRRRLASLSVVRGQCPRSQRRCSSCDGHADAYGR